MHRFGTYLCMGFWTLTHSHVIYQKEEKKKLEPCLSLLDLLDLPPPTLPLT